MSNYIHYDQRKAHTRRRISLKIVMFWWFWYFQHKQYWAQGNVNCLHSFIHSCWLDIDLTLSQRPYEIHSATPIDEILNMFKIERVHYSSAWCKGMIALLKKVRKHKHLLYALLSISRSPPHPQQCRGIRQAHTLGRRNFKGKKAVLIPRFSCTWVVQYFLLRSWIILRLRLRVFVASEK